MHSPGERIGGSDSGSTNKQVEFELMRLRIKELELRIELERLSQQRKYGENEIGFRESHAKATTQLPKREIQHFDGNPKNYCSFMKAFQNV